MRRAAMVCVGFFALAGAAGAQSFEGVYNGAWDGSATAMGCDTDYQGMDGGPFVIRKTEFFGVESSCDLANPTALRGIDGILYDATCFAEGDESTSRLMLVREASGGVYMYLNGYMRKMELCQ